MLLAGSLTNNITYPIIVINKLFVGFNIARLYISIIGFSTQEGATMKKVIFFSLVVFLLFVLLNINVFAKNITIKRASSTQNALFYAVFDGDSATVSTHSSEKLSVNPTSKTDIWYINCRTGKTTDLEIQIEGDLLSLGIARGPDCPDIVFGVYPDPDQKVRFFGTTERINGTILIVASKNGGLIKATSTNPNAQVEAERKWGSQVYSVTVDKPTLSQSVFFDIETFPVQKIVCSWPGNYFPVTSFGYREHLEGGLLSVNVFNVLLAPSSAPPMSQPVFVNLGRVKTTNPSSQATTWSSLRKGDSK